MARIEIIDFTLALTADFDRLNREWLEQLFRVEEIDQDILTDPQGTIIAQGGNILFARRSGDIVGTVALKHQGENVFELTKMAVSPEARGEGIGRQLLRAAIDRFLAIGGSRLYLESHSSLRDAIHLYETAGFRHEAPPAPSEYARADVYMVYRGKANQLKNKGIDDYGTRSGGNGHKSVE